MCDIMNTINEAKTKVFAFMYSLYRREANILYEEVSNEKVYY